MSALWHPFTQMATAPAPLEVVSASGAWLELADGRRILDAVSSWWTITHGHSHPAIAAAIAEQAARLDHVMLAGCTHPRAAEVADRLATLMPGDLDHVFFSDDGSTAVEVALKMAFQFHGNRGDTRRQRFVALHGGYHGDTLGAMSVGDPSDYHAAFRPLLLDVQRAAFHRVDGEDGLAALLGACGSEVAAVIVEPMVQGAGGMRIQSPEALAAMAELTRDAGALFIADEVMTGFGRTGRMFACEHASVVPDIACVAKGLTGGTLPLAATVARDHVYQAFLDQDRRRALLHGHSFTGNPIACAAAVASMGLLETERSLERVAAIEAFYARRLPAFRERSWVADARWLGDVGVVELAAGEGGYFDRRGPEISARMIARGFLVRPLGPVLYTLPPYCVDPSDLAALYDTLDEVAAEVCGPAA